MGRNKNLPQQIVVDREANAHMERTPLEDAKRHIGDARGHLDSFYTQAGRFERSWSTTKGRHFDLAAEKLQLAKDYRRAARQLLERTKKEAGEEGITGEHVEVGRDLKKLDREIRIAHNFLKEKKGGIPQ